MEKKLFDWNNPKNNVCVRCGITQEESNKLPAVATGINHPDYDFTKSFYLAGANNGNDPAYIWCPRCHRESELEKLFAVMDKRDKEREKRKGVKV